MEPITHLMTGACLARTGCNRKAAYATLAMVIAAEIPDIDTLWSIRGPVAGFEHHRGITHTLLGLPFEGLAVVAAVWLFHRWRLRRAQAAVGAKTVPPPTSLATDEPIHRPLTAAPVRWVLLYGFVLIALLSHILLDWTNNYGIRPFFPFNPHWYADPTVFIFDPLIFAVLLIALIAPALLGLIGSEVGARKPAFRGRGWAIFALLSIVAIWGWRQVEHDAAIQLATTAAYGPTGASAEIPEVPEVLRITASPDPLNPYLWHVAVDTPGFYQLATVNTLQDTVDTNPRLDILYKSPATPVIQAAERSRLGHVYLDWSTWPVVTDTGPAGSLPDGSDPTGLTAVTFRDLRFMYDTSFLDGRSNPPLSGTVYLDPTLHIAAMEMAGHMQH